jgi:hypothetical protein
MFFEYRDDKIHKTTFQEKKIIDILKGSFVLKLEAGDLPAIYFASDNDDLWTYLKLTGRIVDSLVTFIDKYVTVLEGFDWKDKTWQEMVVAADHYRRSMPSSITIERTQTKESETHVSQGDSQAERFNNMLR